MMGTVVMKKEAKKMQEKVMRLSQSQKGRRKIVCLFFVGQV